MNDLEQRVREILGEAVGDWRAGIIIRACKRGGFKIKDLDRVCRARGSTSDFGISALESLSRNSEAPLDVVSTQRIQGVEKARDMRIKAPDKIRRHALFSGCKTYRYTLERYWGDGPVAVFILLNPSTADTEHDDPTNRRGMDFARRWGYDGCIFLNLFAFRTPTPLVLKRAHEPIGPGNDTVIKTWCAPQRAGIIVAAWGIVMHMFASF